MSGVELPLASPNPEARRLAEEGRRAERAARREEARDLYERALRALGSASEARAAGTLLRWIGRTHAESGDPDAALDCYEAALAVAKVAGDGPGAASAVNSQAIVAFGRGRLDRAERLWRWTRREARTYGARKLVAMVEQNLGNVAGIRGDLEVALTRYRTALHTYRALEMQEYVGAVLNNLGMTLTDLGRRAEAREALEQGIRVCRETGDVSVEILLQVSRARLHVEFEEWERARDRCEIAHELALEADDRRWLGEIFRYYGAVFRNMGRHNLAEDYLERARRHAVEQENLLLEAETAREEAELHRSRGESRETLRDLNRAHRLFSELRARRQLADVDRRLRRLEEDFLRIVREWGESIESKDRYTRGHCERVAELACGLARAADFPEHHLVWFRMGALLHDVGKMAVPLEILNKPGELSEEEWEVMRSHPEEGVRLLGDVEFPWNVRPMIRHHHERWDGSGYPGGLAGEEIALSARILCVADVFDALTTNRSYRDAFSVDAALEIMEEESGSAFDPELLDRFVGLVREGEVGSVAAAPGIESGGSAAPASGAAA